MKRGSFGILEPASLVEPSLDTIASRVGERCEIRDMRIAWDGKGEHPEAGVPKHWFFCELTVLISGAECWVSVTRDGTGPDTWLVGVRTKGAPEEKLPEIERVSKQIVEALVGGC